MPMHRLILACITLSMTTQIANAEELKFTARSRVIMPQKPDSFTTQEKPISWNPNKTAIIVCDVWDYHHCLNAVRRLEEFAPRMNDLVKHLRGKGVTVIHSPSDCMETYKDHPARKRAMEAPMAAKYPEKIKNWCSRIPAEEKGTYPIDQSDGGEDDDPKEHAEWAEKLKSLGRNPKLPWKAQSKLIEIIADNDFISDKGDEVWNILESRKIDNVILVGVHVNMCVLGRPFGLRQMARNGKNAILVRDMTDAMYNPDRWPYVDHLSGTDLIISHIEKYVCPTTTSDQFLGGKPFRYKNDKRASSLQASHKEPDAPANAPSKDWKNVVLQVTSGAKIPDSTVAWYRANIHLPGTWVTNPIKLNLAGITGSSKAWLNGQQLAGGPSSYQIPDSIVQQDDANLLVIRVEGSETLRAPALFGKNRLILHGRWQMRTGDDAAWANMPLPAKFGAATDIYYEP